MDVGGEAPMELWRWRERRGTELRGVNAGEQVAFSPDGRLLIAGDGVVAELPSGRVVRRLPTAAGQSPAFAPRGGLLAMAGPAGVTLWDTRTWRPSGVRLDDRYPSAPAFSPDGRSLAASTPAGVRLWDVATGRAIGAFTPGEEAADLAFAPSGALLYAAGPYGEVRAEEVDPVRVARRVCALAGRELSREEWRRHIPELPYRRVCGHAR
ncbi:WD40 repeat domain-containing protein [Thermocatellispora tengchongensis]|uniref:WD40 repeat domain-containing protein n=1 Tax=Thermocatellispora tengchongensis TaxID=1073253 RepID=UPI003644454E